LGGGVGCASTLRGPDTDHDVHFHLTYFLARTAGFDAARSLAIAGANSFTDEHPETTSVGTERRVLGGLVNPVTIPRIMLFASGDLFLSGESLKRCFGRRTAEATAWTLSPLAYRLHFPAADMYAKVRPAFVHDPKTGELTYNNGEAVEVLERAFRALETRDPDEARALALLGIGLHTLQDSYKHRDYCAAQGHIGAAPDPDDVSWDVPTALRIAESTYCSLAHTRRLLGIQEPIGRLDWKGAIERLYSEPLGAEEQWRDRWIGLIRATFGDVLRGWEQLRDPWRMENAAAFERALEGVR
jgi:hypothetical protein